MNVDKARRVFANTMYNLLHPVKASDAGEWMVTELDGLTHLRDHMEHLAVMAHMGKVDKPAPYDCELIAASVMANYFGSYIYGLQANLYDVRNTDGAKVLVGLLQMKNDLRMLQGEFDGHPLVRRLIVAYNALLAQLDEAQPASEQPQ